MLTRKDFKAMASAIAAIEDPKVREQKAKDAAVFFAASNPRFDRSRFFQACNVKEN